MAKKRSKKKRKVAAWLCKPYLPFTPTKKKKKPKLKIKVILKRWKINKTWGNKRLFTLLHYGMVSLVLNKTPWWALNFFRFIRSSSFLRISHHHQQTLYSSSSKSPTASSSLPLFICFVRLRFFVYMQFWG